MRASHCCPVNGKPCASKRSTASMTMPWYLWSSYTDSTQPLFTPGPPFPSPGASPSTSGPEHLAVRRGCPLYEGPFTHSPRAQKMPLARRDLGPYETLMRLHHVAPAVRRGSSTLEADFWGHLRDLDWHG